MSKWEVPAMKGGYEMELLTVSNIAVSRFILGRIKYATLQMQHLTSPEIKTKIKICPP